MSVEVHLDDFDVTGIAIGNRGAITFEALSGIQVEGIVTAIIPNVEKEDGGAFLLRYKLPQVPPGVRWGLTAEVFID